MKDGVEYHDSDIKFDQRNSFLNHKLNGLKSQIKQKEIQIVNTRLSVEEWRTRDIQMVNTIIGIVKI